MILKGLKAIAQGIREMLSGRNGRLSSKRFFMLLITINATVDWQHAIWTTGRWTPETQLLEFIGAFFGIGVVGALTERRGDANSTASKP